MHSPTADDGLVKCWTRCLCLVAVGFAFPGSSALAQSSVTQTFSVQVAARPMALVLMSGPSSLQFGSLDLRPGVKEYDLVMLGQPEFRVDSCSPEWSIQLSSKPGSSGQVGLYYLGGGSLAALGDTVNPLTAAEVPGCEMLNTQVAPCTLVSTAAGPLSSAASKNQGCWVWRPGTRWRLTLQDEATSENYRWVITTSIVSTP